MSTPSSTSSDNYFCHQCGLVMQPLMVPDPTCSRCRSDFVEKIEQDNDPRAFHAEANATPDTADGGAYPGVAGGSSLGSELATSMLGAFLQAMLAPPAGSTQPAADSSRTETTRATTTAPESTSLPRSDTAGASTTGNTRTNNTNSGGGGGGILSGLSSMLSSILGHGQNRQAQPQRSAETTGTDSARPVWGDDGYHVPPQTQPAAAASTGPYTRVWTVGNPASGSGFTFHASYGTVPQLFGESGASTREGTANQGEQTAPDMAGVDPIARLVFNMVSQMATNPQGNDHVPFAQLFNVLATNPGDYDNQQTLDDIITQMMNQAGLGQTQGVDDAVIDALAMERIKPAAEYPDGAPDCAVCKDEFASGEDARQLPCKHIYHDACIRPWLKQSGTCPVCRARIDGERSASNSGSGSPASGGGQGVVPEPLD
ncbi:hypothetical protein THASP1DRAFT_24907 [Thamnocephalis sphaerospora]|uniref:RING-type domain-containing protein n=1 Tax=Thamnocephalis sphaerospora TaxID=78915 RepID=A0A4P9XLT0_9FUNG|nr:hypothetical protein THASP1DRAFT_24907 [Thamnocephalis sphaerospora]|eukprot:RKP06843.1 hypothetical protein THASP1DRAFT_24907 [Thamnocephalis sphaerospora]